MFYIINKVLNILLHVFVYACFTMHIINSKDELPRHMTNVKNFVLHVSCCLENLYEFIHVYFN